MKWGKILQKDNRNVQTLKLSENKTIQTRNIFISLDSKTTWKVLTNFWSDENLEKRKMKFLWNLDEILMQ